MRCSSGPAQYSPRTLRFFHIMSLQETCAYPLINPRQARQVKGHPNPGTMQSEVYTQNSGGRFFGYCHMSGYCLACLADSGVLDNCLRQVSGCEVFGECAGHRVEIEQQWFHRAEAKRWTEVKGGMIKVGLKWRYRWLGSARGGSHYW